MLYHRDLMEQVFFLFFFFCFRLPTISMESDVFPFHFSIQCFFFSIAFRPFRHCSLPLSLSLSFSLSLCLCLCVSLCLCLCLCPCLCFCLSLSLSLYLSIYLSIYLTLCVCVCVRPSSFSQPPPLFTMISCFPSQSPFMSKTRSTRSKSDFSFPLIRYIDFNSRCSFVLVLVVSK